MSRSNGKLRQLNAGTAIRDAPWIGWGIIGLLLTMVAFFGVGWIKNIELRINETERDIKQIQLTMQAEKTRSDAQAIQVSTLTGYFDRIQTSIQAIEARLIKSEYANDYRLKSSR